MRAAGAALAALLLLVLGGCRDGAGAGSPGVEAPGGSVDTRLDDLESTLDGIESELNDG